jgi:hypothetical protein
VIGRAWKSFEVHARKMDVKGDSGEVSDGEKTYDWKLEE